MVKIENFSTQSDKERIKKLLSEKINKCWLRDLFLGKKGPVRERELTVPDFFEIYILDNLTNDQKNDFFNSLNLLIEEDVLIPKYPGGNYIFDLLDTAVMLNEKYPGKINYKPFIIWKERNYFNLSQPVDPNEPVIKRLTEQIEKAFGD